MKKLIQLIDVAIEYYTTGIELHDRIMRREEDSADRECRAENRARELFEQTITTLKAAEESNYAIRDNYRGDR